jgi:hypothetical protein
MAWEAALMTLDIYWLVIAPALLLGVSLIGWIALWITRPRPAKKPKVTETKADVPRFYTAFGVVLPGGHVRFSYEQERQREFHFEAG